MTLVYQPKNFYIYNKIGFLSNFTKYICTPKKYIV
jgi:hypothetical protein